MLYQVRIQLFQAEKFVIDHVKKKKIMVIWSQHLSMNLHSLIKSFVINEQSFKPNTLIQDLKCPEFNAQSMAQLK